MLYFSLHLSPEGANIHTSRASPDWAATRLGISTIFFSRGRFLLCILLTNISYCYSLPVCKQRKRSRVTIEGGK